MNQVVLVGRLLEKSFVSDDILDIKLSVKRSYKDKDGNEIIDTIPCRLYGSVATNTDEYCDKDSIIGIRGTVAEDDGDLYIKAEKVTFLASKKDEEENE